MPIFPFIQAVLTRVIVGTIAILSILGVGSLADSPTYKASEESNIEITATTTAESPQLSDGDTTLEEVGDPTTVAVEEKIPEKPTSEVTVPEISLEDILPDEITVPPITTPSFKDINIATASTLVNVLCSAQSSGAVNSITGSGVIIDPRGVVITNAHVAQFFLLQDYPTKGALECILRAGSPARATYTAELLYIPPVWVLEHANDITNKNPKGTGEHDYAFLRITGRTNPQATLPATFPYLPIKTTASDIEVGHQVLVSAYPAGFITGITVQKDLYIVSSVTTIGERFTFKQNTIDLLSVGGTVVSQGGSSGGAVVSANQELLGIVVTSTQEATTAERDLRAITLGHINRSLFEYAQTDINLLLNGDLALKSSIFNLTTAPSLTNLFIQEIEK